MSALGPDCEKSRRILERLGQHFTLVVESLHTSRYLSTVMMLEKNVCIVLPPTFLGLTFFTVWVGSRRSPAGCKFLAEPHDDTAVQ
jgi:hypothetical protein